MTAPGSDQIAQPPSRFPVPWLVVTTASLVIFVIGTSAVGIVVVLLLTRVLAGSVADLGPHAATLLIVAVSYVGGAMVLGTLTGVFVQRRTFAWLVAGREPDPRECRSTVRLPRNIAAITLVLWLVGAVVLGILHLVLASPRDALRVVLAVVLSGLTVASISYGFVERAARPWILRAVAARPPDRIATLGVLPRLLLTWLLTTGIPLAGVLLVVTLPSPSRRDVRPSVFFLALVGLTVGAFAMAAVAHGYGRSLRELRRALRQVESGHLDVAVRLSDSSEIGLLQTGFNRMVAGLRERERLRDLFGRHVGEEVARHALAVGADLQGEVRHVVALFVDVVGSTTLATRRRPDEVVALLNRFFARVIDAVAAEGGLVNKFVGDAALCVFGAPAPLPDPAAAALRAGRAMRARIQADAELDLGIGIAFGAAFAGQLGTLDRLEYTVIGDPVNEAARLADLAKTLPGRIAVAQSVVGVANVDERQKWRHDQDVRLRGRDALTAVYVPVVTDPARS